MAYEFVKYDASKPEEMARLQKQIALIKEKQVSVSNANQRAALPHAQHGPRAKVVGPVPSRS
jgi:Fe-S cluster biosynthesis and repair protein YggX